MLVTASGEARKVTVARLVQGAGGGDGAGSNEAREASEGSGGRKGTMGGDVKAEERVGTDS